jgi:hypothetical protein
MDNERLEKLRKEHTRFLIKDGKITRILSWDADSLDSKRKYSTGERELCLIMELQPFAMNV